MTDRQFIKRMISLTEKMCELYNAEPIDQIALHHLRLEISILSGCYNLTRRRRPWFMFGLLVFVCLIFCWIVYDILFYL